MTTLEVILITIIVTVAGVYLIKRAIGMLQGFRLRSPVGYQASPGTMSKEEEVCVSLVERQWRKPLLHYLRTLEAPPELQQYLVSNKRCLKEVKLFLERNWYEETRPRRPTGRAN